MQYRNNITPLCKLYRLDININVDIFMTFPHTINDKINYFSFIIMLKFYIIS